MNCTEFTIRRQYDISCKLFEPETVQQVIIGVHGFAGDKDSSMLKMLAEACAPAGVALLCFDFPAHGKSPVAEDMLTAEHCKQDLLSVCRYAESRYPQAEKGIFATSFGGYISLLCADQLPDYRYILRAPAVTMPRLLLETVLKITAAEFAQKGSILCGFERPIRLPYAFYQELLLQEDLLQKPIQQKLLLIHGDCDDVVPLTDILQFQAAHPDLHLHIIEGADHRFKKPGQLQKIVSIATDFL